MKLTVIKQVTHYARNCHGQPNANASDAKRRVDWSNYTNASSRDAVTQPGGSATSKYDFAQLTKNSPTTYSRKPWTFTGHDFLLDIPDCAYIRKIVFTARIKVSGKINVKAPVARFNLYNGTKYVETYREDDTGWEDGYYYVNPNKKLTNTWQNITYTMSGNEFRKRGYPISELRETRMGIDLKWYNNVDHKVVDSTVSIQYISCFVEYELPDQKVEFNRITMGNRPHITPSGEPVNVYVEYRNDSNAGCCNGTTRDIKVTLPPNAQIVPFPNAGFDENTMTWTVRCIPNNVETLNLFIKDYGTGLGKINFHNDEIGDFNYYIYSDVSDHDVGEVTPYPGIMQRGVNSCVKFVSRVNASDGMASFVINMDTVNNTNPNVVWNLSEDSSEGVEILESSSGQVMFSVPRGKVVDIVWTGCFVPDFTGESNVSVKLESNPAVLAPYNCLPAPTFVVRNTPITNEDDRTIAEFEFRPSIIQFITHRVATSTELGAYVIDCGIAPLDADMIIDNCTLTAGIWKKHNYIGMVELPHSHYDPDSTYENKEIFKSYKNKTYAGKEGSIDEDISLKFKIPPKDSVTLQGLVELDKPTPINTNWQIWEGDPLNHRGWAVLSKVKIEKTNPLWYDVDATVKYITHDINTKFQIFKGLPVNNVNMPSIMADTFSLGDNLSTGLNIFDIDTDGGFIYDEDGDEGAKNIFSLDEGQVLSIKTRNPLADVAHVYFDWYSNRINEKRENKLERIFRIIDADGNSIFEYEYYDFVFTEDYVNCKVVMRVKDEMQGWTPYVFENVDLRTELYVEEIADEGIIDVEYETSLEEEEIPEETIDNQGNAEDMDNSEEDDGAYDDEYIAPEFDPTLYDTTLVYGTSLELIIKGNKLSVYDAGYNGREVVKEDITLINSSYTFESVWTNFNQDGTTEDIISYIDVGLSETVLSATYSEQYSDLLVSPFPIPKKTIVFTRESEEGTIYYLTGQEPFKYRLEPFYQYLCGTDLVTREGSSIFNLNNSHTYFYIENGLVRLGFNKYSGSLYLAKWDIISKQWISTHFLHMSEDTKFSLETYSDDNIVIKAGDDTYFSIWRGHPYVMIQHPNTDISIDSKFTYCLSDSIDGVNYDYPVIASFMNQDNLLPICIGGKSLDYDCILIDDDEITPGTNHTITVSVTGDVTAGEEAIFNCTIDPFPSGDGEVHYLLDGVDIGSVESPFSLTYAVPHVSSSEGHTLQAVYTGDEDDNIAISEVIPLVINPPVPREGTPADTTLPEIQGKYSLRIISAPSKFTYRDNQQVVLQLLKGQTPVNNMPVEIQYPNASTGTIYTNYQGIITITNNKTSYVPGRYQWGGRFYDNIDADHNGKVLLTALKWITIVQATPTFTHNDADGRVKKGKSLTVKLNGVDAKANPSKVGLEGKIITYTINGGTKKSKKTNKNGTIQIPCNVVGDCKIKVMFAGSVRYKAISKTFNIKVVK